MSDYAGCAMSTHRLFVALRPPRPVRDLLRTAMHGLSAARWQDDDQLHLTLRFVGDVDAHLADDLAEALARIHFAPFDVAIEGFSSFARRGRVHTLFAQIAPSAELVHLQRKVERVCIETGLAPEQRKYHPHITIARLNQSCGPVEPFLASSEVPVERRWRVGDFALYESHLRAHGAFYETVVRYPASE